jgi:hypothetical protein
MSNGEPFALSSVDSEVPATQSTDEVTAKALPRALRIYAAVLLAFWGFSVLPLLLRSKRLWSASPLWLQPPFFDFGCYYDRMKLLHTPAFWTGSAGPTWDYPAPGIFVYQFFYLFNHGSSVEHRVRHGFIAYAFFAAATLIAAALGLARGLNAGRVRLGSALVFCSMFFLFCWPVYFSMQRGNIDFVLDAGLAGGLWAYARRRWWVAAALLGAFGSAKLYPLIFLLLLLTARRWGEFVLGCVTAGGVTLFAAHWIGPVPETADHAAGIVGGLQNWIRVNSLSLDIHLSGYDHSLFGFLKVINAAHPERFAALAIGYAAVGCVGMLLVLLFRVWKLPRPNQVLLLAVAAVVLPPTSFDYTLMLLVPGCVWLIVLSAGEEMTKLASKTLLVVMAAFAAVFAPETFAAFHGLFFAGQVKLFCLLVLFALVAVVPFPEVSEVLERPSAMEEPGIEIG